jgi:hypothetical protein
MEAGDGKRGVTVAGAGAGDCECAAEAGIAMPTTRTATATIPAEDHAAGISSASAPRSLDARRRR